MWPFLLLLIPAILGILAVQTDILLYKVGVPAVCGLILLAHLLRTPSQSWPTLSVVAAFLFSMLGDYFLSNKGGNDSYSLFGIGAYFVAHIGYLGFALAQGKPNWIVLLRSRSSAPNRLTTPPSPSDLIVKLARWLD